MKISFFACFVSSLPERLNFYLYIFIYFLRLAFLTFLTLASNFQHCFCILSINFGEIKVTYLLEP